MTAYWHEAVTIPILNIYHLLTYAWDVLDEADIIQADAEQSTQLVDLFGRVLSSGTAHLIRRGLDRGYIAHREELAGVRGKIDIAATVKSVALLRARVVCEFDELSYDVTHNRILKATIRNLLMVQTLDPAIRAELAELYRRMPEIADIPVSRRAFGSVQLHRNNRFYRFLLTVCRFIHEHLLVNQETGQAEFRDFVRDEKAMRRLFERFVRNFFRRHAKGYTVTAEHIQWQRTRGRQDALTVLPKMITDTSIFNRYWRLVIETKFVPEALTEAAHGSSLKIRTSHLYQLFAYLMNLAAKHPHMQLAGILLYPWAGRDVALDYEIHGHFLGVRTLRLDQPWPDVEREMLQLLNACPQHSAADLQRP